LPFARTASFRWTFSKPVTSIALFLYWGQGEHNASCLRKCHRRHALRELHDHPQNSWGLSKIAFTRSLERCERPKA
jgi:hypothetical protein